MARKSYPAHGEHCTGYKGFAALVLIVLGVLFLLRDLNVWNFWNIQWWTVVFLLFGIKMAYWSCKR